LDFYLHSFPTRRSSDLAKVLVTNSSFTGGFAGVFADGAPRFDTFNSTFSNFSFSGIQYQGGSGGRIEGNTVSDCGSAGCIRVRADRKSTRLNSSHGSIS